MQSAFCIRNCKSKINDITAGRHSRKALPLCFLMETDKTLTGTCFFRIIKVNRCLKNKSGITGFGEPEGRKNMRKLEVEHCDLIHSHSDTVRQIQEKIPEEQEIRGLADFF